MPAAVFKFLCLNLALVSTNKQIFNGLTKFMAKGWNKKSHIPMNNDYFYNDRQIRLGLLNRTNQQTSLDNSVSLYFHTVLE